MAEMMWWKGARRSDEVVEGLRPGVEGAVEVSWVTGSVPTTSVIKDFVASMDDNDDIKTDANGDAMMGDNDDYGEVASPPKQHQQHQQQGQIDFDVADEWEIQ